MPVDIRDLLKAGAHFGHQKQKWNPKMAPYIFTERNGVHIINLQKTVELINEAEKFVRQVGLNGDTIFLVGTKRQAMEVIKNAAERAEIPYVNYRWLGGMLTNYQTISESVKKLKKFEDVLGSEKRALYTKKEIIQFEKKKTKLEKNLSGIALMEKMPSALFVIDPTHEHLAVKEASKLGIPVIALIDTNGDPDHITYPIPANDDGMRTIDIILTAIVDSYLEGHDQYRQKAATEDKERKDRSSNRGGETRSVAGRKVKVKRIVGEGEKEEDMGGEAAEEGVKGAPQKGPRSSKKEDAAQ